MDFDTAACGKFCLSCFTSTDRPENPKLQSCTAQNAGREKVMSSADARATPTMTKSRQAKDLGVSRSPSRKKASTTVVMGSEDLTVSTKGAEDSEKATFVSLEQHRTKDSRNNPYHTLHTRLFIIESGQSEILLKICEI